METGTFPGTEEQETGTTYIGGGKMTYIGGGKMVAKRHWWLQNGGKMTYIGCGKMVAK
jgi:hypothetical protein